MQEKLKKKWIENRFFFVFLGLKSKAKKRKNLKKF